MTQSNWYLTIVVECTSNCCKARFNYPLLSFLTNGRDTSEASVRRGDITIRTREMCISKGSRCFLGDKMLRFPRLFYGTSWGGGKGGEDPSRFTTAKKYVRIQFFSWGSRGETGAISTATARIFERQALGPARS